MRMLPCPYSRTFSGFSKSAVRQLPCIYQLHITGIRLLLFIQQLKNPPCSCHGHDNTVHLLAELGNGLCEAFIQSQERNKSPQGQARIAVQCQDCAHNGTEYVADISQIGINRHHDIGNPVCQIRTVSKLPVYFPELLQALFFMAENLHHLLPFHHFLDVTVHTPQIRLLLYKILSRQSAEPACGKKHDPHHEQSDQSQGNIQENHTHQSHNHRNSRINYLRNALPHKLAQCIHIIGIYGHDIPMGMGIKIFNRQGFHMHKNPDTEISHRPLTDIHHNPVIAISAYDSCCIYDSQ